jgi:hypothetical protein
MSVFLHITGSAVIQALAIFFLVAIVTYVAILRFFFMEFSETLKETFPDTYWMIHILLFTAWCFFIGVMFTAVLS